MTAHQAQVTVTANYRGQGLLPGLSVGRTSVVSMSDETRRAREQADGALNAAQARADECKRECLNTVAVGIPAAVDAAAKKIAQSQPDVTRQLGPDGVKALREELAAEAATLAEHVRAGTHKIEWPTQSGGWATTVEPHQIHSALFKYMYGRPINLVANVFGRYGYDVQRTPGRTEQGLLLPQSLYVESSFDGVAAALTELGEARRAHAKAKADDDQDAVDELWS